MALQVFIHSNGTIACNAIETEEVEVKNDILLPDYVFNEDYRLK